MAPVSMEYLYFLELTKRLFYGMIVGMEILTEETMNSLNSLRYAIEYKESVRTGQRYSTQWSKWLDGNQSGWNWIDIKEFSNIPQEINIKKNDRFHSVEPDIFLRTTSTFENSYLVYLFDESNLSEGHIEYLWAKHFYGIETAYRSIYVPRNQVFSDLVKYHITEIDTMSAVFYGGKIGDTVDIEFVQEYWKKRIMKVYESVKATDMREFYSSLWKFISVVSKLDLYGEQRKSGHSSVFKTVCSWPKALFFLRLLLDSTWEYIFLMKEITTFSDPNYVYFIRGGEYVKIGMVNSPELSAVKNRLCALQTSSPYKLRLIHVERGGRARELELHKRFNHLNAEAGNEWFLFSDEVKEYIASKTP